MHNSSLTQMSIGDHNETVLAHALVITDEVSILLQQNGIDPSSVNRLFIPAGFTRVGSFTILTYLDTNVDWLDQSNLWAMVGPLKWPLSRHYQIHRMFPNWYTDEFLVNKTLAVVSFSDFRYEINLSSTGTTDSKEVTDNDGYLITNSYTSDWRVGREEPEDEEEDFDEETEGKPPFVTGVLDEENWPLFLHVPDEETYPALHNDNWTMWDVDTRLSRAALADMAIRSAGGVALPYPVPRVDLLYGSMPPDFERPADVLENDFMTIGYIGSGWDIARNHFNKLASLYMDGQISYSWVQPKNQLDGFIVGEIEDDMTAGLDEGAVPMPEQPIPSDSKESFWTGTLHDGLAGIPESITVQFPAKSSKLNKIMLYTFRNIIHGRPDITELGDGYPYAEPIFITDHIKSHAEFDVTADPPEDEAEILAEDGISVAEYDLTVDVPAEDLPRGLTEYRVRQLLTRAVRLSRMYYARFYAGTGTLTTQGFTLLHPWAGMLQLEYGFRGGMPYTKTWGNVNDERFGFEHTDFAKHTIMTSGGAIMSRPDGSTELAISTERPLVFPVEIEEVYLDEDGCRATYLVRNLVNGKIIGDKDNQTGVEPWREIPEVCYLPVEVGMIGMITMSTLFDNEKIEEATENGYYLFIVKEEVQTTDCQEQAGDSE